jgi:hypothetical protein
VQARVLALYLPQFHPIPENDEWWGKGFTEWTNVANATRLFPGHEQPHVPRDLGFYDLRVPETRQAQADLARAAGIEAFCYWHYWFAGRRILERPFQEVLDSAKPDFPFCLAWANQTWSGTWHDAENRVLIEQTYPGEADYRAHFAFLLRAFHDRRYLRVDGKPLFAVLKPQELPDARRATDFWRELAVKSGLPGLYLVALGNGELPYDAGALGFDAHSNANTTRIHWFVHEPGFRAEVAKHRNGAALRDKLMVAKYAAMARVDRALGRARKVYWYRDALEFFVAPEDFGVPSHPTLVPNWDHSPRCGERGIILHKSTPSLFRQHVRHVLHYVERQRPETRLVFVKSWNEWAEGNYLEPDLRWGDAYLRVLREELLVDGKAQPNAAARLRPPI